MKNLIIKLLANAVALAVASWVVGGITLEGRPPESGCSRC